MLRFKDASDKDGAEIFASRGVPGFLFIYLLACLVEHIYRKPAEKYHTSLVFSASPGVLAAKYLKDGGVQGGVGGWESFNGSV